MSRIARLLQINRVSVILQFPEFAYQLRDLRAQKRCPDFAEFVDKLEWLKDDLTEKGLPFTLHEAELYTGKRIRQNSAHYEAFISILNDEIQVSESKEL